MGTTSLKPFSESFGSTALVQRLFVRMLVTMWLLLVHGKQECLGVGPVCNMGLPRFQHFDPSKNISEKAYPSFFYSDQTNVRLFVKHDQAARNIFMIGLPGWALIG